MSQPQEIFSVEAQVVTRTMRAVLIKYHEEDIWIPISQIPDPEELPETGNIGGICMSAWIAKKIGLR